MRVPEPLHNDAPPVRIPPASTGRYSGRHPGRENMAKRIKFIMGRESYSAVIIVSTYVIFVHSSV